MVKKAQIRFVAFTMCIIFVIFGAIYGFICLMLVNDSNREISNRLNIAIDTYTDPNKDFYSDGVTLIMIKEFDFKNGYIDYEKLVDNVGISDDTTTTIINDTFSHNYKTGSIDTVYFKSFEHGGKTFIVLSDMSENVKANKYNFITTLFGLLVIYFVMFAIVLVASFTVLNPVKETLSKQKRFISDASHELKTPVAVISANTDVLKSQADNKYLTNIKSQTERINLLVNDMLTLARMDENSVKPLKENFSATEEVLDVCLPFEAVAYEDKKTFDFQIQPDVNLFTDKKGFVQLIGILIDNAVKYSPEGGVITVSLKKEGNKTVLSVHNFGSEVPDGESQKIFERFYRAESSRSRNSGGSGLGLSIAHDIAKLNKWKIHAKSEYGKCMTITVII